MRKADNLPPYRAVVMKSGSLNFLEPSGPAQACYGRALPLLLHISTCVFSLFREINFDPYPNICGDVMFSSISASESPLFRYCERTRLQGTHCTQYNYEPEGRVFDSRLGHGDFSLP